MRRICWPLIIFQIVWMNLIVPGHTRGIITVASAQSSADRGALAAEVRRAACCGGASTTADESKVPTPAQQKRCAICFVASGYGTPPVFDFIHHESGTTSLELVVWAQQVISHHVPLPYFPNGPPPSAVL